MKKLFAIMTLVLLSAVVSAQVSFDGFFSKKNGTPVAVKADGDKSSEFFIRPAANLSAMTLSYNKELKVLETAPFSAAGIGVGLQHYEEHNGVLINNYGFNALIIVNGVDPGSAGFGIAATVNALQFVNVGAGYDFTNKRTLVLIGASWSF